MFIYEGDLKDEETVLEFLTDDDNFSMGDKIEDVDAESLINIIETDPYVSVFFYDDTKESSKALEHMEDIDDETQDSSITAPSPIHPLKRTRLDSESHSVTSPPPRTPDFLSQEK